MEAHLEKSRIYDNQLKINIFAYSPKDTDQYIHPHWHEAIEILYMIKGDLRVTLNNRSFVLSQGNIAIIGSDDIHSTSADLGYDEEVLVFHISPDLVHTLSLNMEDKDSIELFINNGIQFPEPITEKDEDISKIIDYLFNIKQEFINRQKCYSLLIKSYILSMIGIFLRKYSLNNKKILNDINRIKTREMLMNTFSLIDEKYMDKLTLEMAAKASHLSVSHFCRILKNSTGMTFNQYLTEYRIKMAERILGSEKKLSTIAHECGFQSITSFIRAFKTYRNFTPSQYKKRA